MVARSAEFSASPPARVFPVRALPRFFSLAALATVFLLLSSCGKPLPFPENGEELIILVSEGPLSYDPDQAKKNDAARGEERAFRAPAGLEHDLALMFAEESGVSARFVVTPRQEIRRRLAKNEGHLAMGWLSPTPNSQSLSFSKPLFETRDTLVRHEASLPIRSLDQIAGQKVYATRDSRQYQRLRELKKTHAPNLQIAVYPSESPLDLLAAVARREVEFALVDEAMLSIGLNFYPMLEANLPIDVAEPIVWLFPADGDLKVRDRVNAFLARSGKSKTMTMLRDRYLGHLERLTQVDITVFLTRIETLLPRYQEFFQAAARETAIDWRLLAALSYQESHWNPLNTSYTGVRGIMMLTGETADRLGVSNRLDPEESIRAGARYLNLLKSNIPASTPEPDRTWQTLAAYNIGPGHFNAARKLAGRLGADGDSWYEMKRILPLMARPEYYGNLKSGRARGGEAVIMVENIRLFYDILQRHLSAAPPGLHARSEHNAPQG
ncbi:MAG: membrane-bound lytic murein transglycosylase MltF [Zoogloeaceae bacterium]|jgi:membrane-bound lytic murein transglycosylase F|nr:membrane-bound lytic murein transglycosylase MltF [Zoogloeaceae bacterium]